MPIVDVEGFGEVEFPDTMSGSEIQDALNKRFRGLESESTLREMAGGPLGPLPATPEQLAMQNFQGQQMAMPGIAAMRTKSTVPDVVQEAEPGTADPHELLPAIRLVGGQVVQGEWGDTHPDIIKRNELDAKQIDQRGFYGKGKFWPRIQAAQATQLPTDREPGMLHSTDLPALAPENVAQTPEQLAMKNFQIQAQVPDQIRDMLARKFGGYEQIPTYLKTKPLPVKSTLEQAAYAAGTPFVQMGKVPHGIFADFTRTLPERLGGLEKEGGPWRNLKAAIYDAPEEELPITKELSKEKGLSADIESAVGSAVQMGGELAGVAGATALGVPPVISAPIIFGSSTYAKTGKVGPAVQSAAIGIAFPAVDKFAGSFAAPITAKLLKSGRINATQAKAVEAGIKAAAQGVTFNAISAPDYINNPEQWRRILLSNLAQGAMFAANDVVKTFNPRAKPLAVGEINNEMRDWLKGAPEVAKRVVTGEKITAEQRLKAIDHVLSTTSPGTAEHYKLTELKKSLTDRKGFEAEIESKWKSKYGTDAKVEDKDLGKGVVSEVNEDGSVTLSRNALHNAFENHLDRGMSKDKAIEGMLSEEFIHSVVRKIKADPNTKSPSGDQMARDIWQTVSPAQRFLVRRVYQDATGKKLSDMEMGHELIRFVLQRSMKATPQEMIFLGRSSRLSARFWLGMLRVVQQIEKRTIADTYRDEILTRTKAALDAALKGAQDASKVSTPTAVHGDVRAPTVEGPREVPVKEGSKGVLPQAEGRVAEGPQVPLTAPEVVSREPAGKGKETVTIKTETGTQTITASPEAIDKIVEKAPPTAPTEGGPPAAPVAPAEVAAAKPGVTAPVEPAKAPVAPEPEAVKAEIPSEAAELQKLADTIQERDLTGPEMDRYDELLAKQRKGPAMRMREMLPEEVKDLDAVVAMPVGAFGDTIKAAGISPTRAAYMLADTITTPERLEAVKQAYKGVEQEIATLMKEGHMNAAVTTSMSKGQFLSEAIRMHDARNAVLAGESIPDVAKRMGVEGRELMRLLHGEAVEEGFPAMRIKDMNDQQLEDYMRPMKMAAGDDPVKKQAAYEAIQAQIAREEQAEFEANQPKELELGVGPEETPTPAGFQVQGAMDAYLNSPIEPKQAKRKKGETEEEWLGRGPVTPEYTRPSFSGFIRDITRQIPGVTEDAVRWLWTEKVWDQLVNASGKRLEDWRKALKLEGRKKYGIRQIPDPPKGIIDPNDPNLTPDQKVQALISQKERKEAADATALEIIKATSRMTEGEAKEYLENIRKGEEDIQKYRKRLIAEIARRLNAEAIPEVRSDLIRKSVSVGDIAFDNPKSKLGAYRSFSSGESKNVSFLENWLDDEASTKHKTATTTKRLTVLVNRKTGNVDVVSTYRQPKSKGIKIYDPILEPSPDKTHHGLESVMGQFRVKASILLSDPVKNFHMRFEADPETGRSAEQVFMDAIGKHAEAAESHVDRIWMDFLHEKGEKEEDVGAPLGMREQDVAERAGELPTSRVTRGEGGSFTGPLSDKARAAAGVLRSNLRYFSRGPMSTAEAEGFYRLLDEMEVSSVADIKDALSILAERSKQIEITGKRRGLRGTEYSALVAIDKAVKKRYFEVRQEEADKQKAAGQKNKFQELNDAVRDISSRIESLSKEKDADKKKDEINMMKESLDTLLKEKKKYDEGLKMNAMYRALNDLYKIYEDAQKAEVPKEAVTEGHDPIAAAFTKEALDKYGDHIRRALESAPAPEIAPAESGARSLLGKERKPIRRARMVPEVPPGGVREPVPPERIGSQLATIELGRRAEAEYGPRRAIPPEALTPLEYGKVKATGTEEYRTRYPIAEMPGTEEAWSMGRGERAGKYLTVPKRGIAEGPPQRVVTREQVAMRFGPSRRVQEEMAAEGRVMSADPGVGISPEDAVNRGRELLKQGKDPLIAMQNFEETGRMSEEDMFLARAYGEQLQREADHIQDDPKYGRRSEEFRRAFRANSVWMKRFKKMATAWNRMGMSMQGESDVDTGSFTAMERNYEESTGEEFSDEQVVQARKRVERTKKAVVEADQAFKDVVEEATKPEPMEPQVASMAEAIRNFAKERESAAMERLRKRYARPEAPAMRFGKEDLEDFSEIGASMMVDMSTSGALKFGPWEKEMRKVLGGFINEKDLTKENMSELWHEATKKRQKWIAEKLGPEKVFEPVKEAVTKRTEAPTRDEVVKVMAERKGRGPTPQQAKAIWEYVKKQYVDKGETEFDIIRHKVAIDLGMPVKEVTEAMAATKRLKRMTDEMYRKMANRRSVINEARNWLKNQKYPWEWRLLRKVPRVFFIDKVFGHGTVGLITHAGNMLFDPRAWKVYFPAWVDMYKMVRPTKAGAAYHERRMQDLKNDPLFILGRRSGLQNDPFKYTDDYQVVALTRFFSHMIGNRGFDALKTLRQARFNQIWNGTPEKYKTPEMAALIADSVNHATGIVKGRSPEWTNWAFFAPKLEGSRWAWMVKDPAKAIYTFRKWNTTLPEERYWAMHELMGKAAIFGMYASLLAMNQGLLKAVGSSQNVNAPFVEGWDPRRGDFLSFKIAGFNLGVVGPMIGMIRLFVNLYQAARGPRKGVRALTGRGEEMYEVAGKYARGKLSPFGAFGYTAASQSDYERRPVPWSTDKTPASLRRRGKYRYTWGEYLGESFAPIPAEEAIREVWRGQGMDEPAIEYWLKAIGIAGVMAGTGARVTEDTRR